MTHINSLKKCGLLGASEAAEEGEGIVHACWQLRSCLSRALSATLAWCPCTSGIPRTKLSGEKSMKTCCFPRL